MARKRSNNPDGRPKEYTAKMRLVSVSLPEPLISVLDHIAEDASVSRQRAIVEMLLLACTLNKNGYIWTDGEGTHYDGPFNKTNLCKTPETRPTVAVMAERYAEMAKRLPADFPDLNGLGFVVKRDCIVDQAKPVQVPPGEQWWYEEGQK